MSYDTFICYRGQSTSHGESKKIAETIYKMLGEDAELSALVGNVHYSDLKGVQEDVFDIERIVKSCTRFIVVLCKDFFNGFESEESVTHKELLLADIYKCTYYPVVVGEFDWDRELEGRSFHFDVDKLRHSPPYPLKGQLTKEGLLALLSHEPLKKEVSGYKNTPALTFEKSIATVVRKRRGQSLSDNELIYCPLYAREKQKTIKRIPLDAYSQRVDSSSFGWIPEDDRMALVKPLFARSLLDHGRENCEAFGLSEIDADEITYWSVDCGIDARTFADANVLVEDGISVCAVSFGALMAKHGLKYPFGAKRNYEKIMKSAVRMLVTLRDPYDCTWPSRWGFHDQSSELGTEGTINQTTISLSALMVCDFLRTETFDKDKETDRATLWNRFTFIRESVEKLYEQKKETYQDGIYWGYMAGNRKPAVLPTAFCLDTFLKYAECLSGLSAFFDEKEKLAELERETVKAREVLSGIVWYFADILRETDDGYGVARLETDKKVSLTHTAYVVKSLCAYLTKIEEGFPADKETKETAKDVAEKCLEYLINRRADFLYPREDEQFDIFQKDEDNLSGGDGVLKKNTGERYEHCVGMVYADAVLKGIGTLLSEEEQKKNLEWLNSLFRIFNEEYVENETYLFVRGVQPGLKYPIYCSYSYEVALMDYLKLRAKLGLEDEA